MPFSSLKPAGVEQVRRLLRSTNVARDVEAYGTLHDLARAELLRFAARNDDAAMTTRAPRTSGRTSHGTRRASATSVPHTCRTYGLPVARAATAEGIQCACTRSASRAARRAATARTLRGTAARVRASTAARGDSARSRRRSATPKCGNEAGRHDIDLDPALRASLQPARDEVARHLVRRARVRRRQDDDLHSRAKTTGIASASATNA